MDSGQEPPTALPNKQKGGVQYEMRGRGAEARASPPKPLTTRNVPNCRPMEKSHG